MKKTLALLLVLVLALSVISCSKKDDEPKNEKEEPKQEVKEKETTDKKEPEKQKETKPKKESVLHKIEKKSDESEFKTTSDLVYKNSQLLNNKPKENIFFVKVNNNKADFDYDSLKPKVYERYSELDKLGRVGVANAVLGKETMPTKPRVSSYKTTPTGWKQVKYDIIKTQDLYNHCHLIAFQLSGKNDEPKNIMTGTRQFNAAGMTQFENKVANYIDATNNHVRYRVTPYFKDNELVARGVQIEAYSIEDSGKGVNFNVYVYNTQKGIKINYATGDSELIEVKKNNSINTLVSTTKNDEPKKAVKPKVDLKLKISRRQRKYHHPSCRNYNRIKDKNAVYFKTTEDAEKAGCIPAKCCN